jgi:predicted nuclease of predicted toxin-antitoxin system
MKLKLDENLGGTAFRYLEDAGCDVSSVVRQNLCGTADRNLIEVCAAEGRCLVTLGLDFSNPIQFPPENYAGIVVLRLPKQPSGEDIINCLKTLIAVVPLGTSLAGTLRIVSKGRVREYGKER